MCLFFMIGCGTVTTDLAPKADGVPYYLPRSLLKLTFTPTQPAKGDKKTPTPPTISAENVEIADLTQRYVASYAASPFADDRLCIKRTETGLLEKVYFSADDRLDDFLINVVQLIAQGGEGSRELKPLALPGEPTEPISMLVDPFDPRQIAAFNRLLGPYRISFPNLPPRAANFTCPADSVCFATRVSVPVVLSTGERFVGASKVDVVDTSNHASINIKRALMTERVTKLDLTNGILTGMRVRKNSEALAVSEFPMRVLERLISTPGNAIALSFASYEEKKAYLDRQKALATTPMTSAQAQGLPVDVATCLDKSG
jgi:hypothetical protein